MDEMLRRMHEVGQAVDQNEMDATNVMSMYDMGEHTSSPEPYMDAHSLNAYHRPQISMQEPPLSNMPHLFRVSSETRLLASPSTHGTGNLTLGTRTPPVWYEWQQGGVVQVVELAAAMLREIASPNIHGAGNLSLGIHTPPVWYEWQQGSAVQVVEPASAMLRELVSDTSSDVLLEGHDDPAALFGNDTVDGTDGSARLGNSAAGSGSKRTLSRRARKEKQQKREFFSWWKNNLKTKQHRTGGSGGQ